MARYVQLATGDEDGSTILIEVDSEELESGGVLMSFRLEKVGIKNKVQDTIAIAQATFSTVIENTIQHNVQTFIDAVDSLPEALTEVEVSFGGTLISSLAGHSTTISDLSFSPNRKMLASVNIVSTINYNSLEFWFCQLS